MPKQGQTLLATAVTTPTIFSIVGVDAAALFQLYLTQSLGMSPTTVGLILGLGLLTLPIQLSVAGSTLTDSQRRLPFFYLGASLLCAALVLAGLASARLPMGLTVLIVAMVALAAELGASIMVAPAWQATLARQVRAETRQFINGRGRSLSRSLLILVVATFGALGSDGRIVIISAVGATSILLGLALRRLRQNDADVEIDREGAVPWISAVRSLSSREWRLIAAMSVSATSTWPLFVSVVGDRPETSNGAGWIVASLVGGGIVSGLCWRVAEGPQLRSRARNSSIMLLATTLVLVPLWELGAANALAISLLSFSGAFASTRAGLALLELLHLEVEEDRSVALFTVADVAISASAQASLVCAAGLLLLGDTIYYGAIAAPPAALCYVVLFVVTGHRNVESTDAV